MIKMSKLIKQQNDEIRKETGMVKEENLNEVDFSKIKLPSVVDRFLNKFVDSMKGANLNRMKNYTKKDINSLKTSSTLAINEKSKKLKKEKEKLKLKKEHLKNN